MAESPTMAYEQIYTMVRNGYTGDSSIWDRAFDYLKLHPQELFYIAPNRRWSLGHQIIYHGALQLFQRLLEIYNEKNPIDITTKSKDSPKPSTILDIATERKSYYKQQYEYIVHLFDQDRFIRACKEYNWPVIDEMLTKCPSLLNEKPPYCSNYFIHYLVLYGDVRKFDQYNLPDNKFQLDLQNADGKTALDLARAKRNQSFIEELEQLLPPPRASKSNAPNDGECDDDRRTPTPPPTSTPNVPPRRSQNSKSAPQPILPPEILKNITCRLTKKIFVDPVVASDGQTYERSAILEYIQDNRYSPTTGEAINDSFTDNVQMKDMIRDLRQKNLI